MQHMVWTKMKCYIFSYLGLHCDMFSLQNTANRTNVARGLILYPLKCFYCNSITNCELINVHVESRADSVKI